MMQPAQSILRKNAPGGGGANSVARASVPLENLETSELMELILLS